MDTTKAPTINDIAKRTGVHRSAVAAVLNGGRVTARVSDATRQRIVDAAAELRYVPNAMARGLNGMRLKSLGISYYCSSPDYVITDYYCVSILHGILNTSRECGYNATHFHRPWRDAHESAASFRSQGIDGFLIVAPLAGSDMVSGLSAMGIPIVVISTSSEVHNVPAVDVDNDKGVRLVLDHLMSLGHRRIAHLYTAGIGGSGDSFDSTARRESFLRIMMEAGVPVPPEYLCPINGDYLSATYAGVRALLSLPGPPTALFATNDWLAHHAVQAAVEMGLSVPEQLSVVGFDDNPTAVSITPVTTIRQPLMRMAEAATRMLIELVEGEPVAPVTRLFEPELIVRHSTMPPGK